MNFIEMYRINNSSYTIPYDRKLTDKQCLIVGVHNGKYGIKTDKGEVFLPFEYDNITLYGFNMLQLVKNGKLGLLHIEENNNGCYTIARLIPCDYDVIDGPKGLYVFLKKYRYDEDGQYRRFIQVYFTKSNLVSEEFIFEMELNKQYGHELISLCDGRNEVIFDANSGCPVYTGDCRNMILGGYETENGTVVQQMVGSFIDDNGKADGRLLLIEGDTVESYDYEEATYNAGDVVFRANFFAITNIDLEGESKSVGFITGERDGFRILDERLKPMTDKHFSRISLFTSALAIDDAGAITSVPFKPINLDIDEILL